MKILKKFRKNRRKKREAVAAIRHKVMQTALQYQSAALSLATAGVGNDKPHEIVVSLTSFGQRVNDVYLTIESLFHQSLKADKIILWLASRDFSFEDLPEILKAQAGRGLQICFCDEDLGPYTKFYYTLQDYPESLIVTVDDDILYPLDMIDMLYREYLKEPSFVHCHRAHKMCLDGKGGLLPYQRWEKDISDSNPSSVIFPTGVGGVLYSPGCFADEILDKETFLKLAPNSDDVWLKAMTLKKQVMCKKVQDYRDWGSRFLVIDGSQKVALKRQNKSKLDGNDQKIKAVFDHYELWDHLKAS